MGHRGESERDAEHVAGRRVGRARPGEQLVEHDTQRVDVGGCGHQLAAHLLGRGVLGCEHAHAGLREPRLHASVQRVRFEQLGDTEIEQRDLALRGDEEVRGLEVPVDDEVAVRVRDRLAGLLHQPQPLRHAQSPCVAVVVERLAVHVLHREPRRAGVRTGVHHAGVEEPRHVRVIEPSEHAPLDEEARHALGRSEPAAHDLERHFSPYVVAHRQVHGAHPTATHLADEAVGADAPPGHGRATMVRGMRRRDRCVRLRRARHERRPELHAVVRIGGEHAFNQGAQRVVARARRVKHRPTVSRRALDRRVERRARPLPPLGGQRGRSVRGRAGRRVRHPPAPSRAKRARTASHV